MLTARPIPPPAPMPEALQALAPVRVGAAARCAIGGPALRLPPVCTVAASAEAVLRIPGARAAAPGSARIRVGAWRIIPGVARPAAWLAAQGLPLDALGLTLDGTIIDPLAGRADWHDGPVPPPTASALRARPEAGLVWLALASELDRPVAPEALAAMRAHGSLVLRADRRAVRRAWGQLLMGRRPAEALGWANAAGLLALTLPEVHALIGFHETCERPHKDIWDHTRQVVRQSVPRLAVRWAALLHDVAKVPTRAVSAAGKVSFLQHDSLGAVMVEGIAHRLCFPPALGETVRALVALHLRAATYAPGWSDGAVRRLAAELGPHAQAALWLARADVTSKRPGRRREALANVTALSKRLAAVAAEDAARAPKAPRGLGGALMQALSMPPGPRVGALRAACEAAIREGALPPDASVARCVAYARTLADAP